MKESRHKGAVLWLAFFALAGALGVWVWTWRAATSADPLSQLGEAAARLPSRLIEARLSSIPWAPRHVTRAREGSGIDPEVIRLRALAAEIARDSTSPRIAGLAGLIAGDPEAAVTSLAGAAQTDGNADVWSDLSAAYLQQGTTRGTTLPIIDALAAADGALRRDPRHAAATFNRALALERLGILGEAKSAWASCQQREPGSPWAREAADAIQRLDAELATRDWKSSQVSLTAAVHRDDHAEVRKIVRAYPREARRTGEASYAPAWAQAIAAGDFATAREQLALARAVGTALAATSGERLLADAVQVIDESERDPERRDVLVRAYLAYYAGRIAHMKNDAAATPRFREAEELFARAGSSMQHVARYYTGSVLYGRNRIAESSAVLDPLFAQPHEQRGYFALIGETAWETGLAKLVTGDFSGAAATFARGRAFLHRIGETTGAARMQIFEADTLDLIGDAEQSWHVRAPALAKLAATRDMAGIVIAVASSAVAMMNRQEWQRAAPLADLAVTIARETDPDPARLASALLYRSIVRAYIHADERSRADLRELRVELQRIGETDVRKGLESDSLYAEALMLRTSDPAGAAERLTLAIESIRENGRSVYRPRLHLERARAFRRLGALERARADLLSGIDLIESSRGKVDDLQLRASMIAARRELFDDAVAVAIASGDVGGAIDVAERARARTLLESFTARTGDVRQQPLSVSALQAALADDAAIVEYVVHDDHLSAIVISARAIKSISLGELEPLLERARGATLAAQRQAGIAPLEQAWNAFVAPLEDALRGIEQVAFVPDRRIAALPFVALYDSKRHRFLIDDKAVLVAPSATLAITCSRRASRAAEGTALAIGSDAFDMSRYPTSEPLAWVAREARDIAALYPGATLLRGEETTAARLLAELPRASVIHYAGHSIARPYRRSESALLTARDGAASALKADEIARLTLTRARLVVLSACQSGLPGDAGDGIENIATAFLVAGVPSVVAASWNVGDRESLELARRLHAEFLRDRDAARAYRDAVRAGHVAGTKATHAPHWAVVTPFGGSPNLIRREID